MIGCLVRQRPDFRDEIENLGEQEIAWMIQMVNRAQNRFAEAVSSYIPVLLDDEGRPPRECVDNALQRATYRYE